MIPQTDPKASYLAYREAIDQAIARVLEGGWYILGKEVAAFEREFAAYLGAKEAVGVANGTDAVELSLRACGIGHGDVVFTVSHTAVATVAGIERAGATPVLVDIDPVTYTMDPQHLAEAVAALANGPDSPKAKAIVVVHLYGHPADMPAVLDIAARYGLRVIEDCAQAHGATLHGRRIGTWGDIAAFSFYPTKNLGAFGDGGIIVTNDGALAERLRAIREYGWTERYISTMSGVNSRLDEMQAAMLRVKLAYLDEDNARRRGLARIYTDGLCETAICPPSECSDATHVYHQYVVRLRERNGLREFLKSKGIATAIHYPIPVHEQPAYRHLSRGPHGLAASESACREILSMPIFPQLAAADAHSIADAIRQWYTR